MSSIHSVVWTTHFRGLEAPSHIIVHEAIDSGEIPVSWPFDPSRIGMAKRRGAHWDSGRRAWMFPSKDKLDAFTTAVRKQAPDLVVRRTEDEHSDLAELVVTTAKCSSDWSFCEFPLPLPPFVELNLCGEAVHSWKAIKEDDDEIAILVGKNRAITAVVEKLRNWGARVQRREWEKSVERPVRITNRGWAVHLECDLDDPRHLALSYGRKFKWVGVYPNGVKRVVPWTGVIRTTRKGWPRLAQKFEELGIKCVGDDPNSSLSEAVEWFPDNVPGWATKAPNGHCLHEYQRDGVQFCVNRGMRALIADEMGVGKTAQAIAAAEATRSGRILIVCPASARYVWQNEIKGWSNGGRIQHITGQLDPIDSDARWIIATYDALAVRRQLFRLRDSAEREAFLRAFPERYDEVHAPNGFPIKVVLDKASDITPDFADKKRVAAWKKAMRRLKGELVTQLVELSKRSGGLLAIFDEAHRAKNASSKRAESIRMITSLEDVRVLLLTGTPLRNSAQEARTLLGYLDPAAERDLCPRDGYSIEDVRDYLGHCMLRRTKSQVLPELPDKIRQVVAIGDLDPEQMGMYFEALSDASDIYRTAITDGGSEAEARQATMGLIERARVCLGMAKTGNGSVSELITEVVDNQECCVVFTEHRQVSDQLQSQLHREGLRVVVVDGRTAHEDRGAAVKGFQAGDYDVFIGSINVAGEAMTLTRAETAIFVELSWVPAAMLQAEDRIHRVGQQNACQIIQLVAEMGGAKNLDALMANSIDRKLELIGEVLEEELAHIVDSAGAVQVDALKQILAAEAKETA